MWRLRGDAGNQGSAFEEMPDVQKQGRAADFARLIHPEGQWMVRDGLCQEEHAEQHRVGFGIVDDARHQRRWRIVERFVVENRRVEAGSRIQIGVI